MIYWRRNVLHWLQEHERTQRWLGRKVGISPEWVNRILRGKDEPSEELVKRIAEVTGLKPPPRQGGPPQ